MLSLLDARDLKGRCDFISAVRRYVRLRRAGRQYVGLCPFHKEKHPSFYVESQRKIFYCFGCGAGGDVFDFIMRVESCDFRQALQILAAFPGVARDSEPRSGERFGAGVGASPPAAKRPALNSPDERARIVAQLDATEKRLQGIRAANAAASAALATACEPRDEPSHGESQRLGFVGVSATRK